VSKRPYKGLCARRLIDRVARISQAAADERGQF
jgi:hypothetical protein